MNYSLLKLFIFVSFISLTSCSQTETIRGGHINSSVAIISAVNFVGFDREAFLTKVVSSRFKDLTGKYGILLSFGHSRGYQYSVQDVTVNIFNGKGSYVKSKTCTASSYGFRNPPHGKRAYSNSAMCSFDSLNTFLAGSSDVQIVATYTSSLIENHKKAIRLKKVVNISQASKVKTIKLIESDYYSGATDIPTLISIGDYKLLVDTHTTL